MGGSSTVPLAIVLVFLGCCSNVVFLELIVKLARYKRIVELANLLICRSVLGLVMSIVCCCCEHREDTGAGNTITFFQFLFISIEGLVFVSHFFTTKPSIPIRYVIRSFIL